MEKYSRPATFDDLKSLIRSLNEQGVDYLLIGGYVSQSRLKVRPSGRR